MKLIIGNKNYSSWSLRGWLACKHSGLPFEEVVVPLYDDAWDRRRQGDEFAPAGGKVPLLWDGEVAVWDSLAIVEYLNEKTGDDRFWPHEPGARAAARSMAAEMHSSFAALRRELPMNIRLMTPPRALAGETRRDVERVVELWAEARARWGGAEPWLFGRFGAADIMFAPVCSRFATYSVPLPRFAQAYVLAVLSHRWLQEWIAAAAGEDWAIAQYDAPLLAPA